MKRLLIVAALLVLLGGSLHAADLALAWDANTEPDIAGYKIYYGKVSGTYDHSVNVGNVVQFTVTGLTNGTWYFAVTAENTSNLESGFSNEVSAVIATPPTPPKNLKKK